MAGVRGDVSILPDVRDGFDVLAAIRSVRITGRVRDSAGSSVVAINFAAASIGSVRLTHVDVGETASVIGLAARSLGSLVATGGATPYRWASRTGQPLPDPPAG